MNNGHIASMELVAASSDDDAIEQGQALFEERYDRFEGFEVWDGARCVYRSTVNNLQWRRRGLRARSRE
jgi:hypothetical protein